MVRKTGVDSSVKKIEVSKLQYCLLPSANPPPHKLQQHNELFQMWHGVWTDTFAKLGLDPACLNDEFIRQDFIAALFHEGKPIAAHLYSFFSIDCLASRLHGYLNGNYPEIFFQKLKNEGVRNVMSMEYMTVHPDWRKSKSLVHLPIVTAGLAFEVMKHYGGDAAIAPARTDHKVHLLAPPYGGKSLIKNVINHNVPCDLLMCHRNNLKPHDDPVIQGLVETLWRHREAYLSCAPLAEVIPMPRKKSA